MAKRINWDEVLDMFCWGLDFLGRPSISRILDGFDRGRYEVAGPGLLRRLIKDDCVSQTGRGSTVQFSITEKGRQRCALPDPTASWERPWDHRWRLFTFDIPESRRKDRLLLWRELRQRRIGLLQRSVWVWPHDIAAMLNEIVSAHGIPECFAGFAADQLFLCSHEEVVATAWDFEEIGKRHEAFLKRIGGLTSGIRVASGLEVLAKVAREERLAYESAIADDPLLPRALWPKGYRGEKVYLTHKAARTELARRLPDLVGEK